MLNILFQIVQNVKKCPEIIQFISIINIYILFQSIILDLKLSDKYLHITERDLLSMFRIRPNPIFTVSKCPLLMQ